METNTIYCGDNLEQLSRIPDKSVDLIYADPPFFSNRHYEIIWKDGSEIRSFKDRWKGGINQYVKWMRTRLQECHRVLKDTGSMYLHCDWHANAHLRIQMDNIFGTKNFRNEIIWHYISAPEAKNFFGRKHDTIFLYSKSSEMTFNINDVRVPHSPNTQAIRTYKHGNKSYICKTNPKGKALDDVWGIPLIAAMAEERIGYPTQKPEALLKRIIEASSNKGDIILDPFCGCGTTIAVAHQLNRHWIGIDVSPTACRMMAERLNKIGATVNIVDAPQTIEQLKALEPFNFQDWIINKIKGTHSNKKTDDKGVDGWTFMEHKPVQIKQSEHVGRNVIDNFQPAMDRVGATEGFVYAFSFTSGAYEEAARVSNKKGITINLITIKELVENELS